MVVVREGLFVDLVGCDVDEEEWKKGLLGGLGCCWCCKEEDRGGKGSLYWRWKVFSSPVCSERCFTFRQDRGQGDQSPVFFCLEMERTAAWDHDKVEKQGHLEAELWPETEYGRNGWFLRGEMA
jgi:hypothetical protein